MFVLCGNEVRLFGRRIREENPLGRKLPVIFYRCVSIIYYLIWPIIYSAGEKLLHRKIKSANSIITWKFLIGFSTVFSSATNSCTILVNDCVGLAFRGCSIGIVKATLFVLIAYYYIFLVAFKYINHLFCMNEFN